MAVSTVTSKFPEFLNFLLSSKPKFDCYFLVGKKQKGKAERIGAVKLMLMAHSEVLRLELEDSNLAEKGDVAVEDIYPDTFKSMLKYVYGYDTTAELCFEEADNMFYAAEKYMMTRLKNKLALRLISLLNVDNICSLLNNPACYTHLELNSAIDKILIYETDRVLTAPQFVNLSPDGFLRILEQDSLAVKEIDCWRAAIKWAKYRVGSQNPTYLRQEISKVSKHLRLCTLSADEFCNEVVPSGVLTSCEVSKVCMSIGTQLEPVGLKLFSNITCPRLDFRLPDVKMTEFKIVLNGFREEPRKGFASNSSFTIVTKDFPIQLLPFECMSSDGNKMIPEGATYNVKCTIRRIRITNFINNTSSEVPVVISCSWSFEYGKIYLIPFSNDGKNMILCPKSKYEIKIEFDNEKPQKMFYFVGDSEIALHENKHFTLQFDLQIVMKKPRLPFLYYYYFPSAFLKYKVLQDNGYEEKS